MRSLWTALVSGGILCLFGAFALGDQHQQGVPGREGDELEARVGEQAARARIRDLCTSLYPPPNKERDQRAKYQDWIKVLICRYMIADFTAPETREQYVESVLQGLRRHGNGAWQLPNGAPVVHIVTDDPAYRLQIADESPTTKKIKSQGVQRSRINPDAAAIGIHQSSFVTPAAGNADEADERIPNAEDLIQRILGLAIIADMIAVNAGAIPKKEANQRVKTAVSSFHDLVLNAATKVEFPSGVQIKPRPENPPNDNAEPNNDQQERLDPDSGRNVLVREPRPGDKPISITKVTKTVGLTRAIIAMKGFPTNKSASIAVRESIEPLYKFKEMRVLRYIVRTVIVIETFYGVPKKKWTLPVTSKRGDDCTPQIRSHENRHAGHFWAAWKAEVIDRTQENVVNLSINFKHLKKKSVQSIVAVEKRSIEKLGLTTDVTFIDIVGYFFFPDDKGIYRTKAKNILSQNHNKKKIDALFAKFNNHAKRLGAEYHKDEQVGLDDDCQPVRDAAKARINFGELEHEARVVKVGVAPKD